MHKKILASITLALSLSACVNLYSTSRDWKLPLGMGNYDLKAEMSVGLFQRQVTISVNDQPILSGQSWFWEDSITMQGEVQHIPLSALCHINDRQCDLTIAGFSGISLNFKH